MGKFASCNKCGTRYHEPHPHPPWVIAYVYFVMFLKYFEQFVFKIHEKSWNFSSHYYVMVYNQTLLKIYHFQKNSNPFTSLFTFESTN
jgi:hypothetical protein